MSPKRSLTPEEELLCRAVSFLLASNVRREEASASMPGTKARSGPMGNLNAIRSGAYSWLRRRRVPPGKQHIARLMGRYQRGLLEDLGGEESVTTARKMLVDQAGGAGGAWRLILDEALCRGFIVQADGAWDVPPAVKKSMGHYMNVERHALLALGLERMAKDITPTLDAIRARYQGGGGER